MNNDFINSKKKENLINAKVAKVLWVTFIKYLNSNHT